jgi:hypothetical protein
VAVTLLFIPILQVCYMLGTEPLQWKSFSVELHWFNVYFLGLPYVFGWTEVKYMLSNSTIRLKVYKK